MRVIVSVCVLLFVLPKVAWQCLVAIYSQKKIQVHSSSYLGKGMKIVQHRALSIGNCAVFDFDLWFHYLKGDLDLIGPRRMCIKQSYTLSRAERQRFSVAPGLITPFKIKQASGIAHKSEAEIAVEFVDNSSLIRRTQLFMIWIVQRLAPKRCDLKMPSSINLFGIRLSNVSMSQALDTVMASLDEVHAGEHASKFAFVNADCANKAFSNLAYKETLNSFQNVYPDGIGVKLAARMLGLAVCENINGTDMFPLLCARLQSQGKSLYLHGASKEVVEKLVKTLAIDYPGLNVSDYSDGYSYVDRTDDLHKRINASQSDLLMVAMGAPRQELWINDNVNKLNVKAIMGVGGLFDFYSGEVSRAPEWLRELSIEWCWRLVQQPKDKIGRYLLGNPLFLFRSFAESLCSNSTKPLWRV